VKASCVGTFTKSQNEKTVLGRIKSCSGITGGGKKKGGQLSVARDGRKRGRKGGKKKSWKGQGFAPASFPIYPLSEADERETGLFATGKRGSGVPVPKFVEKRGQRKGNAKKKNPRPARKKERGARSGAPVERMEKKRKSYRHKCLSR